MINIEKHLAHLQQILEHDGNDLSPNDEKALRYFIGREQLVQRLAREELGDEHDGCEMCQLAKSVLEFEVKP